MINIEEKNIPALLIYIVVISVGLIAGMGTWQSYQANQKITVLLDMVLPPEEQQEIKETAYVDEFKLLSEDAKKYYDMLGVEKVTGTPTWLINGVEYKGFDYQKNIIPNYPIDGAFENLILFSSPTCGFCQSAEQWLEENNISYTKVCAPIHSGDYDLCKNDKSFII